MEQVNITKSDQLFRKDWGNSSKRDDTGTTTPPGSGGILYLPLFMFSFDSRKSNGGGNLFWPAEG